MAWPFGGGARTATDEDAKVTEGHLKVLSNVPIEQVPHPEEGELSEEDAWTIRPGPARAKLNSIGSVASTTQALAPSAPAQVNATVDTSGLERLISSRLDMVEDVLRMVETRVDEAMESGPSVTFSDEDGEDAGMDVMSGDVIITASGERIPAGDGASRLKPEDEAPLVELYEAQALAANPFLRAPDALGGAGERQDWSTNGGCPLARSHDGHGGLQFHAESDGFRHAQSRRRPSSDGHRSVG